MSEPPNERMLHDCAWGGMHVLLDHLAPRYSDEEQRELAALLYNTLRATLEALWVISDRQARRITPHN